MDVAASLYKGGELFKANDCDYNSSRELGLICPLCKESVFLVRGFGRTVNGKFQSVQSAWRHYRTTPETVFCDRRSLTKEGKEQLKQLGGKAQGQRLKLFNRRFWDIFKHDKAIPPSTKKTCLRVMDEELLEQIVLHCRDRWHVDQILKSLPRKIHDNLGRPDLWEKLRNHPALKGTLPEVAEAVADDLVGTSFSVLRLKILSEAIAWLGTETALPSFRLVCHLAVLDCLEALSPPIRTQQVTEMMIVSLTLTDWEKAIASLDNPTRAIGFASTSHKKSG